MHKGQSYPGEHEPILDMELWNAVNAHLAEHRRKHRGNRDNTASLLAGLLYDDRGHPMTPSRTYNRHGKQYRYYLSRALIEKARGTAGSLPRVSADVIESLVLDHVRKRISTREWDALNQASIADRAHLLRHHVKQITLSRDHIAIEFISDPTRLSSKQAARVVEIPFKVKKRGGETLIVFPKGTSPHQPRVDLTLVKALGRAWQWRRDLERGRVRSVTEIARRDDCTERYVSRLLPIAYLAPDIIEAILEGRQPVGLTLAKICRIDIPLDWRDQRNVLGFVNESSATTSS